MTIKEEIQNGESRTLEYKPTLLMIHKNGLKPLLPLQMGLEANLCLTKQSTRICSSCKMCRLI